MTKIRRRETVMAIVWLVLGLTIAIWCATFPFGDWEGPGPGFFPFMLGVIIFLLGGVLLVTKISQNREDSTQVLGPLIPAGAPLRRVASALGAMLLSTALLEFLGFLITIFFLILFLIQSIEHRKWKVAIFYALLSSLSSFIIFQVLLKTQLPRGILGF